MATTPIPPNRGIELARLVSSLSAKGSTIPKLSARFGCQPHTVHAAMMRLCQRGYVIQGKPAQNLTGKIAPGDFWRVYLK